MNQEEIVEMNWNLLPDPLIISVRIIKLIVANFW